MTLNELESDLYRRLGFQASPDPVVTTRLRAYINQTQREILSQKGLHKLRHATLQTTSIANDPYIAFRSPCVRVIRLVDTAHQRVLRPLPLADLRLADPGLTSTGVADGFSVISLATASARNMADSSGFTLVSNSPLDNATKTAYVELYAPETGAELFRFAVALNGTTMVPVPFSPQYAGGRPFVNRFYLGLTAGGGATAASGTIVLSEGLIGTGRAISVMYPGRHSVRYTRLQLFPIPGTAITYTADVDLTVEDMSIGGDEPALPEDFHWVLTSGALLKEWQRMEKTAQYDREKATYREGIGDLKMFVSRAGLGDGKNGNGNGLHDSSFGPWYPIGGVSTAAPHAPTHEPGGNDPMTVDALPTIGSLRTLGSGPHQAAPGDDPRFTSGGGGPHHLTHESGGSDALSVLLLAGYPGGTTGFLRADATFATPATGGGAHHATHEPGGTDALVLTAASRLFGRGSSSAGAVEEIILGTGLAMSGTTMNATGAATPGAHHTTHEPGGTDVLANNAWTNTVNNFTQDQQFVKAAPKLLLTDTAQATDQKSFYILNTNVFRLQAVDDSQIPQSTPLTAHRNGDVTVAGSLLGAANVVRTSDARLTDARTPTAHKTTHEPGGADAMTVDAAAATGSLRTLGTGATQAAPGNDARFTAPSTPTAHATTHQPGGSDAMAVDAAAATGSLRTLGTGATQAAPGNDARFTAAPQLHATTHQPGGSDAMAVDAAAVTGSLRTLGTSSTSACAGNDTRLTNARTPIAHATSHQPGGGDAMAVDAAAATGSLRTLGTGATQAAPGNDARFTDARAPLAHKTTHEPGGSDAMTVDAIAATGSLRTLGTGSQQAAAGNDSRLTNARTPTAHATSHQPGGGDAMAVDAAAATGSLRTLGTGATQAAPGNDARFTDARTPTAHKTTHQSGGSDVVDVKLLGGYPGGTVNFLRADGTFQPPPTGGVPGAHATTHEPGGGDPMAVDALASVGSLRTLGTGANQAAPGNDTRFTAAPQAHHASHEPGGGDALVNAAWTNVANTFTANQTVSNNGTPQLRVINPVAVANAKQFGFWTTGATLDIRAESDAGALQATPLLMDRSGNVTVGNNLTATGSGGNVACKDQLNTFTQPQVLSASGPALLFINSADPADARRYRQVASGQRLSIYSQNDAGADQSILFSLNRSGDAFVQRDVYEKARVTPMGHWTDVPYSAGNFTAAGATWTVDAGDVTMYAYSLVGKTLHILLYLVTTSLSANAGTVSIALPAGLTIGKNAGIVAYKNPGAGYGILFPSFSASTMTFYKDLAGTGWASGTLELMGQFTFSIT